MVPTVASLFDARHNSIGFLRWLMAFLVIFSHAGPLAGFYGGHDLGTQLSSEQSLGGVAVAGFFFSGFLITRSRLGSVSLARFLWRRCLRILPAFWAALLLTAFVLAPLAWRHERGTFAGYLSADRESPLTYVWNNFFLELGQRNIAGMGESLPYASHHSYDWNGSAWTLEYEFKAYLVVALLGLFGAFRHRGVATGFAVVVIVLNACTWAGMGNMAAVAPFLGDPFYVMLFAPFCAGMLIALWGDKVPMDRALLALAAIVALWTYANGGWNIWGQYGFLYVLLWIALKTPRLRGWERPGDFSYGIYIFAWPLMTLGAFYGLHEQGWWVYHLTIAVGVHVLAYLSWHLIEKPALSLKSWTPRWWTALSVMVAGLRLRLAARRAPAPEPGSRDLAPASEDGVSA